MIINCKCGKYQFDVKKSDIGTSGREVQCGICNEKWFYGTSNSTKSLNPLASSNTLYRTPISHKVIFLLIIFFTVVGVLDLAKKVLTNTIPELQNYYILKEQIVLKIITLLQ